MLHSSSNVETSRVVPLKVLAQRPGEYLCKFHDTLEWIDVDNVDDSVSSVVPAPPEEVLAIIEDVNRWIADGVQFEQITT